MLPALDEVDNIEQAVAAATKAGERLFADHQVIVVDDGSTDGTGERVAALARHDPRVRVERHEQNRGYGAALRTGFTAAACDLVFVTDADNQFDLDELDGFVEAIGDADLVIGHRIDRQDRVGRRAAAWCWNRLVNLLFDLELHDVDCAFKLIRLPQLQQLELVSEGAMVSTELVVRLGEAGGRIIERGVRHKPRTAGQASGADPRVVGTAFRELFGLAGELRRARRRGLSAPS